MVNGAQERMQFNQLQVQNTANLYRKTAFQELLKGMYGASKQNEEIYTKSLTVLHVN
jgi:hypothetical protein